MITKETLDQLDKDLDDMLEKATPEELMLDLMYIRAEEYIVNNSIFGMGTAEMHKSCMANFATLQLMKAKREWNLQQITEFGELQTALEKLEECKQGASSALAAVIRSDTGVRECWRANIAMTMMDTLLPELEKHGCTQHDIAVLTNKGADRFLDLVINQI